MFKTHVIGIGYRPLTEGAREALFTADTILASNRLFEVFKGYAEFSSVGEKVRVINKVEETMEFIRNNVGKRTIVLLASGDPLFFGIGRKVLDEFGPDRVEINPDLSSVQLAFARIKEPWDNAFLMSLHGGPDPEKRRRLPYTIDDIPSLLQERHKIGILTDRENNPSAIANCLISSAGAGSPRPHSLLMHVCEKLGYPDERITSGSPEEIAGKAFADPNVVIIMKSQKSEDRCTGGVTPPVQELKDKTEIPETVFGLTEDEIVHSRGLITKDEVRAVSIHKLSLPQKGILWDIGAGSGSVSIEAARLFPCLKVYAIERSEEQVRNIQENKTRFGTPNIASTCGEAPEVLRDLPSPDRVFIGGHGGNLSGIIRRVREKMPKGIIVVNAIALETLNEAILVLENNGFEPEVSQISVSRSRALGGQRHMAALNPVFIVRGVRK